MLEAAKDYIPGSVTNGLGFDPIRLLRELSPQPKSKRVYDRRIDLYLHLAKMAFRITEDPLEKNSIRRFINDTQEWTQKALPRVGLSDFDVRRPEELVSRVEEFKRKGPLEKTLVKHIPLPSIHAPGFLQLRTDLVFLTTGLLVTLLTVTNTQVIDASYARTIDSLRDRCVNELMPRVKSELPDEYAQYIATSPSSDPDNDLIQQCTKIAERHYLAEDDLLKAVTDGERMFRVGFSMTMLGGIGSTIVGGYLLAESIVSRLRRRKK